MPSELVGSLGRTGLMGLTIPPEFGGLGADASSVAAVLEEVARASAAVATLLSVHLSVAAAPIAEWGSPEQKRRFLPMMARGECLGAFGLTEPAAGSDAASLASRYEARPEGFVLNGSKMFITNAASAGVILVFATRQPGSGAHGISAFLLTRDTPGFSIAQRLDKLGLRGSETTEIVLRDAILPKDALLGPEGTGLRIALGALTGGRVGIAACALGVARAAFEEMQRAARANPDDWKRARVAEAFVQLEAAAALVERAARLRDAGVPSAEAASAAKLWSSRAAVSIASAGVDLAGPPGARQDTAATRLLRDARVFPIVEGTTEIQELILGRSLVGR
jgi:alkylation response protein AidB-like acyl-CoA dehydrogenase